MKKLIIITLSIAIAGGFLLWFLLHDHNREAIMQNMRDLCEMVNKNQNEAPAVSALKAARPDKVFAPEIKLTINSPDRDMTITARDLGMQIATARKFSERLDLTFTMDELNIDGDTAHGSCTFTLNGKGSGKGEFTEVRIGQLTWQKLEGKWKISAAEISPLLQK